MQNAFLPICLLSMALAMPGHAAQKAPDPAPRKDVPDPYVERFKQLDRDHDGFVSPAEWPLEPESFKRVDRNQDGRLSAHELLTPNRMRDYHDDREEQALRLDLNRDGRLGRPQPMAHSAPIGNPANLWNPAARPQDRQLFRNLDLNHDDRLSPRELTSAADFDRADRNKDGVITPNEWPKR